MYIGYTCRNLWVSRYHEIATWFRLLDGWFPLRTTLPLCLRPVNQRIDNSTSNPIYKSTPKENQIIFIGFSHEILDIYTKPSVGRWTSTEPAILIWEPRDSRFLMHGFATRLDSSSFFAEAGPTTRNGMIWLINIMYNQTWLFRKKTHKTGIYIYIYILYSYYNIWVRKWVWFPKTWVCNHVLYHLFSCSNLWSDCGFSRLLKASRSFNIVYITSLEVVIQWCPI